MLVQPGVNPESSPSGSRVMTESAEKSNASSEESCSHAGENPTRLQCAVSIKTEPCDTPTDAPPVDIKVEPHGDTHQDTSEDPCSDTEQIKIVKIEEPSEMTQSDDDPNKDLHCVTVKIEEADHEMDVKHCIKASESLKSSSVSDALTEAQQHLKTGVSGDFSRPLFVSPISAFSKLTFAVPLLPAQTKTPEEPREHVCAAPADGRRANRRPREFQNRIPWLWKRKAQAVTSDDPPAGSDGELAAALMYSSDGWTTEDSVSHR